jgi:CheY-like chemotaxis protein
MPDLIKSISSLLWPAIAIVLILLFRPAITAIIESARSRKFTLKIADQELTMEEVSEQQRSLIVDLQAQVVELRKKVEGQLTPAIGTATAPSAPTQFASILWVDDQPKNNSYFIQQLADLGVSVDLALSTTEGLRKFRRGAYMAVISDMGRREDNGYNPTAGLDLLKAIRSTDIQVPFVIFCSARGVREHGAEAATLGATAVTSSPTELFGVLRLEERRGT